MLTKSNYRTFVNHKRTEQSQVMEGPVFLAMNTQGGGPKEMSTFNLCTDLLQDFGRKKLNDPSFKMTGKSIRKLWSTLGHEMTDSSIRDLVPLFMNHSSAVAHRHYNKSLGHSKIKFVSDILRKIREGNPDDDGGDTSLTEENRATLKAIREKYCGAVEAQQKKKEKDRRKKREENGFNPHPRRYLTEVEREAVHSVFFPFQKEHLTVSGLLKTSLVNERAQTDDNLARILKSVAERKNIDMGRAIQTLISSLKNETKLWWRKNANEAEKEGEKEDVSSSN